VPHVRFADRLALVAASQECTPDGGRWLHLVWESLAAQKLSATISVHLVDDSGAILSQTDYPQDAIGGQVATGTAWVDQVDFGPQQLPGATAVGIALLDPDVGLLPIDHGPRDWDDRRLLLPLE
jgi:hypothetical protein